MKYVKKPIPIEAIQWTGKNFDEIARFMGENRPIMNAQNELVISTLEGDMRAPVGAYIICGVTGSDFYPCAKDVFEQSYEPVDEETYYALCPNCNKEFSYKGRPDSCYDYLEQRYFSYVFCPHCGRRVDF